MEEMTLSMILGDDAAFVRQVSALIAWIKEHERPDVIHLSSSLLIGIAGVIRQEVNIPLVCSLQDEEVWIDGLRRADAEAAWKGIRENAKHVDRFVVSSIFYRRKAEERFPEIRPFVEVVYPGPEAATYASARYPEHPVIGFFYRMNEANGLALLAEAFAMLKKEERVPKLRLRIGGGYTTADRRFLKNVRNILKPCRDAVDWCDTYTLQEHPAFYREISAVCVPITFEEGVGLYLCEAFAAGRPAIEPDTGSFGEIVGDAGVLYTPNTPHALADAIERLLMTDGLWERCRQNALQLARTRYNESVMAEGLLRVYRSLFA